MSDNTWLQALKPGDQVVVHHWGVGGWKRSEVRNVDRITKTQIVVAQYRYRRVDGHGSSGSVWRGRCLAEATPERVATVRAEEHERNVRSVVERTEWRELPLATVEAVVEVLKRDAAQAAERRED